MTALSEMIAHRTSISRYRLSVMAGSAAPITRPHHARSAAVTAGVTSSEGSGWKRESRQQASSTASAGEAAPRQTHALCTHTQGLHYLQQGTTVLQ